MKKVRGRPTGDRKLPVSLLLAAENRLHEKSHLDITCREIAAAAGTHAGMISYYFTSKDGILKELLEALVTDVSGKLECIDRDFDRDGFDPTERLIRTLIEALGAHEAALTIIFIEIFRPDSIVRDAYARRTKSKTFERTYSLFNKLVAAGVYRRDLDVIAAVWTVLSLAVAPFILTPLWQASGQVPAGLGAEAWINHVVLIMQKELKASALDRHNVAHHISSKVSSPE